jgi:signal transduction histidine kinase/putative methionine-R-sulfoxide reductase with GAF domain
MQSDQPQDMAIRRTAGLEPPHLALWKFLRARQDQIVVDWAQHMRSLSPAHDLSDSAIVDHLPQIVGRIADLIESMHTGKTVSLGDLPKDHAVDRLGRGFDLDQIVTEYGFLRRAVLDLWESEIGPSIDLNELRKLDVALDESVRQAAVRYAEAREKLMKALDRIAEAAFAPGDLDLFLENLLRVMLDSMESVDTAVVLLRERDLLRVRAAVGLEHDLDSTFSMTIPEGFAGHVAAARKPVLFRDAAGDPRINSPAIRAKGVRALYGVPLMRGDKVIGVAHIGSLTATEFSEEDKLLFRSMASRATSVVVKAQLLGDLRRTESAQRFLSEASRQFAQSLDYERTLKKVARLAVPAIADWCVVDLVQDGQLRRVSIAHADPDKEKLVQELEERYPSKPDDPTGIANVLRTGRPEWHSEIADADLAVRTRGPEHLQALRELGLKAYIIVPIVSREQVLGTIALVTAESNRRYSEADLIVAEDLANRAATAIENARLYREAQNAVQIRERVLAVVSHDLRNLLAVISMGVDLLRAKVPTLQEAADLEKPVQTIRRTASNMEHLLSDLLDMASIRAGQLSIELARVAVKPLFIESCDSHEPIARDKGLRFRSEPATHDVDVICDRRRILQVLGNLLGNAIKFAEAGDSVTLRTEVRDRDVLVGVSDTGPGIPPDAIQDIFDPYRTVAGQSNGGTGLGLYISRGIVERHGTRLWVESDVGIGTTFYFTLPLA